MAVDTRGRPVVDAREFEHNPGVYARYDQWPPPYFATVGARFRNGRHQAGLSQRAAAALAGISQSSVSRFERGLVARMSAERVVRLALALGPRFPFGCCPHDHTGPWPRDPGPADTVWQALKR
jgi:DNA-binding XRE family transcriptional regulator